MSIFYSKTFGLKIIYIIMGILDTNYLNKDN